MYLSQANVEMDFLGLGDDPSLVWAGGAPVADVPPPPAPNFPFACLYSDGSRELATDPSSCPIKPDADLVEVDDLTQVASGSGIPPREPPAIIVNVPIDDGTIPPINIPSPPPIPVTFPPAPTPTLPTPEGDTHFAWWLFGSLAAFLLFQGAEHKRGKKHVSSGF